MSKVEVDGCGCLGCLVVIFLTLLTCAGIVWAWRLLMTQLYGG
jgi:hypothetical protein